jgi:hypothetical protein
MPVTPNGVQIAHAVGGAGEELGLSLLRRFLGHRL